MACTTERSTEIGEFSAGRLDAAATGGLLDHLEGCRECSAEFELVADLVAAPRFVFERPRMRLVQRARPVLAAAAAVALAVVIFRPGTRRPSLEDLASTDPLPAASAVLRSETPPPRPPDYLEAMDLYAKGDFAGAASRLAAFVERSPEDALAHLYLGICRLQTGSPREAIAPLARAAEIGEGLVKERALWYLGNARLALREGEAALEAFERLEALEGDYEPNAREKVRAIREALGR